MLTSFLTPSLQDVVGSIGNFFTTKGGSKAIVSVQPFCRTGLWKSALCGWRSTDKEADHYTTPSNEGCTCKGCVKVWAEVMLASLPSAPLNKNTEVICNKRSCLLSFHLPFKRTLCIGNQLSLPSWTPCRVSSHGNEFWHCCAEALPLLINWGGLGEKNGSKG